MPNFKLKDTDRFVRTETNLFVKENNPARIINEYKFPASIEIICFEFSICNKKLVLGTFFLGHTSPLHSVSNSSSMS